MTTFPYASNVVGNARLDRRSERVSVLKPCDQTLQMAIQPVAKVSHHPLTYSIGHVGLDDLVKAAGDYCGTGHYPRDYPQQVQVVAAICQELGTSRRWSGSAAD